VAYQLRFTVAAGMAHDHIRKHQPTHDNSSVRTVTTVTALATICIAVISL
jgi:hypothetical protein